MDGQETIDIYINFTQPASVGVWGERREWKREKRGREKEGFFKKTNLAQDKKKKKKKPIIYKN